MEINQYRSLSRDVCKLLMNHFRECWKCQENLEKFKACLNHPGLSAEDLATESSPEYNFGVCADWRQIRRPLTDFEAFLTDENIEKLVGDLVGAKEPTDQDEGIEKFVGDLVRANEPANQTDAGFLRRYFQESRKSAIALVRN